jgi:hypothetical protein
MVTIGLLVVGTWHCHVQNSSHLLTPVIAANLPNSHLVFERLTIFPGTVRHREDLSSNQLC